MAARRALTLLGAAVLAVAPIAPAQAPSGFHPRWEASWLPWLGFSANGVWRGRARTVRANRARLLSQREFGALNAPLAAPGAFPTTVVSGTIVEPVVLFKFMDTQGGAIVGDTLAYDSVLYAKNPPNTRPYTVRTYYEQLTTLNGNAPLMTITGKSFGFVALSQNEVAYTGSATGCFGNPYGTTDCNGIFGYTAFQGLQRGLRESLHSLDASVDWTQFSNHSDTLDLVVFIQPARDGACGGYNGSTVGNPAANNHIWAHRSRLLDANLFNDSAYTTHDGRKILDYIVQSGVGGPSACDSLTIMPVGTVAHETGHGFDLPDLYDTQGSSEGVGEYSLMGSGNYTSPFSPSRMDAWSLSQLGWVTVVPLASSADYQFGGAPVSDTTFYVRPTGSNPRGEYFLLENRQRLQSDSAMIRIHGGGGLLIYHVDSVQLACCGFDGSNTVNSGPIHGLEVVQADGRGDLDAGRNRGDAGDPYPGSTANTAFSFATNPAALKNSDGSFVGFAVDSIHQIVANGTMGFRLRFGGLTVVRASDTSAVVQVDASTYHVFRNLLDSGSVHTLTIADTQFTNSNRNRYVFTQWSNGKTTATIADTIRATADTLIASVTPAFRLVFTAGANGTVTPNPVQDTSGSYLASAVTLTAAAAGGFIFAGWTGDTSAAGASLTVPMAHPYTLTANFGTTLVVTTPATLPGAFVGAAYLDTLHASGGTGSYAWQVIGQPPPGLALTASGVLSGTPSQAGTFSLVAKVTSASLQVTDTFTLNAVAPVLSTQAVVAQILNGSGTLTANDVSYLDALGNQNGVFDLGDFLAWLNATGAPAPPVRAATRVQARVGAKGRGQ